MINENHILKAFSHMGIDLTDEDANFIIFYIQN